MGTRGLRVYRLRKRYYALYNNYDSYPEGLGKTIVAEIPSDPSEYQAWLASQRAIVAQWEAQYDKFITIVPGNKFNYPVADGKQEEGKDKGDEEKPAKKIPAYMEHQFPSFFTPLNDTFIEWVYTLVSPVNI